MCTNKVCHIGISSSELISHLKNKHGIKCLVSTLEEAKIVDNPPPNIYKQQLAIPPFQGIRLCLGWVCQECFYCCLAQDSMLKHFQKKHWIPSELNMFFYSILTVADHHPQTAFQQGKWREHIIQSWVQTLQLHQHRKYFRVLTDLPIENVDATPTQVLNDEAIDQIIAQISPEDEMMTDGTATNT